MLRPVLGPRLQDELRAHRLVISDDVVRSECRVGPIGPEPSAPEVLKGRGDARAADERHKVASNPAMGTHARQKYAGRNIVVEKLLGARGGHEITFCVLTALEKLDCFSVRNKEHASPSTPEISYHRQNTVRPARVLCHCPYVVSVGIHATPPLMFEVLLPWVEARGTPPFISPSEFVAVFTSFVNRTRLELGE